MGPPLHLRRPSPPTCRIRPTPTHPTYLTYLTYWNVYLKLSIIT